MCANRSQSGLLARTLAGLIRVDRCLAEGFLKCFETVAQRLTVNAEVSLGGSEQTGIGIDQSPGLVQIEVFLAVGGKPELLRGRAHQHHRRSGDHLDRWDLGEFAYGRVGLGGDWVRSSHAATLARATRPSFARGE